MGCVHLSHEWRFPKVLMILAGVEFLFTIAALALFGIADPNTYRTKLWQIGYDAGYCSNPKQILYAYANYQALPAIPLVWSQLPTTFNLVVSIFSMFVMLVKVVMFIMHMWYPILSSVFNAIIVGLWSFSIYAQAGPDYSDPRHPMPVAWYIAKSCDVARPTGNYSNCQQAKAAFAVACVMLALFTANLALGIHSCIPSREQREERAAERADLAAHMPEGMFTKDSLTGPSTSSAGMAASMFTKHLPSALQRNKGGVADGSPDSTTYLAREKWEMQATQGRGAAGPAKAVPMHVQMQPALYTPRTEAFHTLDRQMPLRGQQDGDRTARFA